jgi:hypothetical protein
MAMGEQGDPYPTINDWGGVSTVPSQLRAFPEPKND